MYTGGEDKTVKLWDMKLDSKHFCLFLFIEIFIDFL
jgi:hypothetical protein